jgi:hypothetical protein
MAQTFEERVEEVLGELHGMAHGRFWTNLRSEGLSVRSPGVSTRATPSRPGLAPSVFPRGPSATGLLVSAGQRQ